MLGECNWVADVRAADGYHPVFDILDDRRGDDVAAAQAAREHVMTRPSTEMMRSMVKTAGKAPSSHNTQPWTFCIIEDRIELVADRTRALPVTDPDDRELTISCGAALFNLELAAKAQGFEPQVSLLPDPSDPDLFARVTFDQSAETVPSSTAPLFDAIESRHTSRQPFTSVDNLEGIKSMLAVAAKEHEVHLLLDVDRETLAELVAEGDRAQFGDPHWRRELASWMHPRRKGDGLVVPQVVGLATRAIVRLVNLGSSTASTDRNLVIDAPIIAVVSTDTDGPRSWLATGRALQHLLLVAASEGVSAGYENQPCQVTRIRPRFRSLIAQGFPQLVVRMGRIEEPRQRTPRRQFEDFATVTSEKTSPGTIVPELW